LVWKGKNWTEHGRFKPVFGSVQKLEKKNFDLIIYFGPKSDRTENAHPYFWSVRSHIESEHPKPGPYKCMLTLTSKMRFGVMHDCQEQSREGDLGGSPGFGWPGRPKVDNILLVRWGVTFGIRAENGSS
jgi:hypothetical protein